MGSSLRKQRRAARALDEQRLAFSSYAQPVRTYTDDEGQRWSEWRITPLTRQQLDNLRYHVRWMHEAIRPRTSANPAARDRMSWPD